MKVDPLGRKSMLGEQFLFHYIGVVRLALRAYPTLGTINFPVCLDKTMILRRLSALIFVGVVVVNVAHEGRAATCSACDDNGIHGCSAPPELQSNGCAKMAVNGGQKRNSRRTAGGGHL